MPSYLVRILDRRNAVILDRWTNCSNTTEALGEAQGTIRNLIQRNVSELDPLGRVDVEYQGRPIARLLISEELRML